MHYGEIYGLLGANGAGKTTTIKMLCGLLEPTQRRSAAGGRARRLRIRRKYASSIGYMSQKFSLYDDLSHRRKPGVFRRRLRRAATRSAKKRIAGCWRSPGSKASENQITGSLPGGWKQRVAFGAAIMHEPERSVSR